MARSSSEVPARPGLGTRCPEAQADGVPCSEIRDCEICRPCVPLEETFIDGAHYPPPPGALPGRPHA